MSDRDEEGILIGLVSVSDRASSGVYEDKGIPALREWCTAAIETPVRFAERLIPDDRYTIEKTLTELVEMRPRSHDRRHGPLAPRRDA